MSPRRHNMHHLCGLGFLFAASQCDFRVILGASSATSKVSACHGFATSRGLHGQRTSRPNSPNPMPVQPVAATTPSRGRDRLGQSFLAEVHESPCLPRFLHLRTSSNRLPGQKPSGTFCTSVHPPTGFQGRNLVERPSSSSSS